jgi:hypothetical protein
VRANGVLAFKALINAADAGAAMLHEDAGGGDESGPPAIELQHQGSSAAPVDAPPAPCQMQQPKAQAAAPAAMRMPPLLAALPKLRPAVATVSAAVGPDFVPPTGSPRFKQQGIGPGLLGLGSSLQPVQGALPRTLQDALRADVLPSAAGP